MNLGVEREKISSRQFPSLVMIGERITRTVGTKVGMGKTDLVCPLTLSSFRL